MKYTNNDIHTFLTQLSKNLRKLDPYVRLVYIEQSDIEKIFPRGLFMEIGGVKRDVVFVIDIISNAIGREQIHFYFDNGVFYSDVSDVYLKLEEK